jgi:menaquinone-dependent protoporphyrinogen oxidase
LPVHVFTATRHGSTPEIGAAIATRLRERGLDVAEHDVGDDTSLGTADPVVLGSPLYFGKWVKATRPLVARLGAEPARSRPLWLFTAGQLGDPPEPADAKPEAEVLALADGHAIDHRMFTGKLDRSKLSVRERIALKAVKPPEGDFRDWDAIAAWADQIAASLE